MENQKEEKLSPEEMEKRREEITKFYQKNLKHLKVQAEYEETLARIDKARFKRFKYQVMLAQFM